MYVLILILYSSLLLYISTKNLLLINLTKLQSAILFGIIYISTLFHLVIKNYSIIVLLASLNIYICILTKNRIQNIVMLLIAYIICVLCDNGLYCTLYYTSHLDMFQIHNKLYHFLFTIATCVLTFLVSIGLKYILKKLFSKSKIISAAKEAWVLILSNLILCTAIFAFNVIVGEKVGYTPPIVTFNLVIFTAYFVLSTIIILFIIQAYMEKSDLKIKKQSFQHLQDYTQRIESMYSDLRGFKHDYINIMTSMSGYIESNDMKGLENYFSENIMPLHARISQDSFKLNQLMNIHILELKSLLSSKLIYANELNINVIIDIMEPITEIYVDIIDLCRIIGVFLDNAIEATQETPKPQISFCMIKNPESVAIFVINTFIDKQIPLYMIEDISVSTKGANRGMGLYNVKTIITNYKNILKETYTKEDTFVQHLEISKN